MWCVLLQRADLEAGKKPDKVMGAQAHKRSVTALQRQIASQEKRLEEVSECAVQWSLDSGGEQCCGTCSYAGTQRVKVKHVTTVHVSLENLPLPRDTHQLFMYKCTCRCSTVLTIYNVHATPHMITPTCTCTTCIYLYTFS